jgi:hypothetical protein
MKKLENLTNVTAPSVDFPYGDLKNNTGTNNGTPVNRALISDVIQFGQKLADEAGIVINDIEDNNDDGWQLYEAFRKLTKPYKDYTFNVTQSGTNAPVVTVLGLNEIGNIVWTRTGVGEYLGTLTGAFTPSNKIHLFINPRPSFPPNDISASLLQNNSNTVVLNTYNGASFTDNCLDSTAGFIRIYD